MLLPESHVSFSRQVSVLASAADGSRRPDSRLFVYDVELDAFQVYDFK
jgi:hypothetical protein